jgi:peptidyl-tRNA hydrolase, PTH1 family
LPRTDGRSASPVLSDDSPKPVHAQSPESIVPRLLVGLGNPGRDYADTRHNIGFMVMDAFAAKMKGTFQTEKRWKSQVVKVASTWLCKPQTYMNLSGQAVAGLTRFHRIPACETLVVVDDIDLPLGRLRLRPSGSAGGHNGLKSLIEHLGTDQFPRLKVGIAQDSGRPGGERLIGHVLGCFSADERPALLQAIDNAVSALLVCLESGLGAAMNQFNRKEP